MIKMMNTRIIIRLISIITPLILSFGFFCSANFQLNQFKEYGSRIDESPLKSWPLLHNGRIKPFETLANESLIFITGKYQFNGLTGIQFFIGIMSYLGSDKIEAIEVRSPELRKILGLSGDRRLFSLSELLETGIHERAAPLFEKEKKNKRALSEIEKKIIETQEQIWVFDQIRSGDLLLNSMGPPPAELKNLIQLIDRNSPVEFNHKAMEIKNYLYTQKWPTELQGQLNKVELEVLYNSFKPFKWACWLFLFFSILLYHGQRFNRLHSVIRYTSTLIPIIILVIGFSIRVMITGFAPVTNMYGTMVWVSLGIGLFGWIFFLIFKNSRFLSLLYFGSFVLLLITEQIPLIISPDMDPLVAVLRSNLWLTIHVLTITISYAAFSVSMLIGNAAIILYLSGHLSKSWIQTYSHYCYRSIQLGCFLLTVGIILGGVWADYSWGRFWGWDPKETWALIADLGYLVILHARLIGWVDQFKLLIFSPLAYLLVIMAWYGVNFILATGLHSYGFSSGGAQIVAIFLIFQLALLISIYLRKIYFSSKSPSKGNSTQ